MPVISAKWQAQHLITANDQIEILCARLREEYLQGNPQLSPTPKFINGFAAKNTVIFQHKDRIMKRLLLFFCAISFAAGFWIVPYLQNGDIAAARQQVEIERLKVKQRLLAVEEVRERQKSALLVARLQKEQLAAQTSARIDNAPEVVAARIRSRVMAASWPFYALFTVSAAAIGVLTFAAIRRVPFRAGDLETLVTRKQAAVLAHEFVCLQGLSEQVRAQAFADETLRERVTAGVTLFSSLARAVRSVTHAALPTAEQAALPTAETQTVPSFADLFRAGKFAAGQPLIFGFCADGQPKIGAWSHAYSLGIAGMSGSGKSSTIRFIMSESLLTGAVGRFFVIDPHYPHPESLLASLGDLKDAPQVQYAENPLDTAAMIDEIHTRIDARIACNEPSEPLLVVVVDELPVIVKKFPRIAELIERIGMESRKAGVYGIFSAQSWNGDKTGGTTARDNLTALLVHKMKRKQAHTLLQDAELTRQVLRLQPGQVLFSPTRGEPEVLTVPFCAVDDMPQVVSRLGAATQTGAGRANIMPPSVDLTKLDVALERNVCGEISEPTEPQQSAGEPKQFDAKATRERFRLTQARFAEVTGVSLPKLKKVETQIAAFTPMEITQILTRLRTVEPTEPPQIAGEPR